LRWDLVSLAGWPLLFLFWNDPAHEIHPSAAASAARAFIFPAAVFILYCAAFRGRLSNRAVVNPWIATVGGMCYTIYLLHNPALGMILRLTAPLAMTGNYAADLLIQLVLVSPILVAVCAGFFVLIEQPCMRRDWPRRLLERLQSRAAEPTAR
jgi:peptidoglycan/LPS O-acetylase OafA/YrhL